MTETALLLINSCAVLESLLEQGEWQVEQASSLVVAEKKLQEKDYPLVLVVIEHQQHEAALFPKSTIKPQLPQPQVTVTLGAF